MDKQQKDAVLAHLKPWCLEVGAMQKRLFRSDQFSVTTKTSLHDLVTDVDRRSEEMLINHIKRHYPDSTILAEESGASGSPSRYRWVIDPLDGTNNYAQGLPVFAISVALQEDGITQLGMVYAPYLDELYSAARGHGAFFGDQRLAVSQRTKLGECVLATGFPYDKGTHPVNNIAYLAHLLPQLRGIRRMGAAAYDLCAVAAGHLDGYWELGLSPWDIAAGALLVEEAGGEISSFRDDRRLSIIAANPKLSVILKQALATVDGIS